ncbi:MAG: gas vesicle protein K [Chloroflexi bacterium]|nr:gas vesicle protein K [Chloroflexota bacterium]
MLDPAAPESRVLFGEPDDIDAFVAELKGAARALPSRVDADPDEGVERGLTKLVLTVIELLRRLLERQALHRVEAGSLTTAEIERMGRTFLKLEARMEELKREFGLQDEDLNIDLGPLGRLL